MDRLEFDFALLTKLRNEALKPDEPRFKIPVLIRSLDDIDPALKPGAKGWPAFERRQSTTDYAKITNAADVQAARAAREHWAEGQRQLREQKKQAAEVVQ